MNYIKKMPYIKMEMKSLLKPKKTAKGAQRYFLVWIFFLLIPTILFAYEAISAHDYKVLSPCMITLPMIILFSGFYFIHGGNINKAMKNWSKLSDSDLLRIDKQVDSAKPIGNSLFFDSFCIIKSYYGEVLIYYKDIIWVFRKNTKHYINGVPTGFDECVQIVTKDKMAYEVLSAGQIEQLGAFIINMCHSNSNWPLVGYSPQLARKYRKNYSGLLSDYIANQKNNS